MDSAIAPSVQAQGDKSVLAPGINEDSLLRDKHQDVVKSKAFCFRSKTQWKKRSGSNWRERYCARNDLPKAYALGSSGLSGRNDEPEADLRSNTWAEQSWEERNS